MITTISRPWGRRAMLAACLLAAAKPAPAAEELMDFGEPTLRHWVRAVRPADVAVDQPESVEVEFMVRPDGTVSDATAVSASNDRLRSAAVAAVEQWQFHPLLEDGKPVADGMRARVVFPDETDADAANQTTPSAEERPQQLPLKPARPRSSLDPDYPVELGLSKLPGQVVMRFTIDVEGHAHGLQVLAASHPAFVVTALKTIARSGFVPALRGATAHPSRVEYPVDFSLPDASPAEILQANGLEILTTTPLIVPPRIGSLVPPVYPAEQLFAGEGATVVAEFTVSTAGRTEEAHVVGPSSGDFDAALLAAIAGWRFAPAQAESGPEAILIRVTHRFVPPETGAEATLLQRLKPGGAGVPGPVGLDRKIQPLWRIMPVRPEVAGAGKTTVEFVIDREGRVRLPRIVDASAPEFGWAAATAIHQWVFEPPRRGGEPVDVKVQLPVEFGPAN